MAYRAGQRAVPTRGLSSQFTVDRMAVHPFAPNCALDPGVGAAHNRLHPRMGFQACGIDTDRLTPSNPASRHFPQHPAKPFLMHGAFSR